jgi:nucleotide-binding universal stress UspA family protein
MVRFQNILVGIDLSRCPRLDAASLGPINADLLRLGRWLARRESARLTLFTALGGGGQAGSRVEVAGLLRQLVQQEQEQGIEAHAVLVSSKGWIELIGQVQRGKHDLVLVGSRNETGLRQALFGSTSFRLLRYCPCPVWVARQVPADGPHRILVPTDLGRTAQAVLDVGAALARGAWMHVLHMVDYPLDHHYGPAFVDEWTEAYHRQVRAAREAAIRNHLEQAGVPASDTSIKVHLVEGAGVPDAAILGFIKEWDIDLVVLGTEARRGFWGALLGNPVERLVGEVRCSVVAVKPPGFRCPVQME